MNEYYLEGKKYYYDNGRWLNSRWMIPSLAEMQKLNKLLVQDVSELGIDERMIQADGAKGSGNIDLAMRVLKESLAIAKRNGNTNEIRSILPRLTSNYRIRNNPTRAIEVAKEYTSIYGKTVYSSALFTSVAAAYCDLRDYETAKKFADLSRGYSGKEASGELISVYARIKVAKT